MIKVLYYQKVYLQLNFGYLINRKHRNFKLSPRQKIPRSDIHPRTLVYNTILFEENIDQSQAIETPYAFGGSLQPGPINNRLLKS